MNLIENEFELKIRVFKSNHVELVIENIGGLKINLD